MRGMARLHAAGWGGRAAAGGPSGPLHFSPHCCHYVFGVHCCHYVFGGAPPVLAAVG